MRVSITLPLLIVGCLLTAGDEASGQTVKGSPAAPPAASVSVPGLTRTQQQRLAALRAASARKLATLRADLWTKMDELDTLWWADEPDEGAIQTAQVAVDALRRKIADADTQLELQILKMLTPAQKQAWRAGGAGWQGWRGSGCRSGHHSGAGCGARGGMGHHGMGHGHGCGHGDCWGARHW
jgi:hypothetical protein